MERVISTPCAEANRLRTAAGEHPDSNIAVNMPIDSPPRPASIRFATPLPLRWQRLRRPRRIARSQADQRLDQPAHPALKLDVALQRDQTNARHALFDNRIVLDGFVGLVEIAGPIAAEVVTERAFQNAGPFGAGVPVPAAAAFRARP